MYKMQTGKHYYGRIKIEAVLVEDLPEGSNPFHGVGLKFIREWFKGMFHGDHNITLLKGDSASWKSSTLQATVPGTVPLSAMVLPSDHRGKTAWFEGQWVGKDTEPTQVQKTYHSVQKYNSHGQLVPTKNRIEYTIHDMIESESGAWIIRNGVVQDGSRPPDLKVPGLRSEDPQNRGEQQEETETEAKSDNTILWVLGILGVSVAGYLALKGKK